MGVTEQRRALERVAESWRRLTGGARAKPPPEESPPPEEAPTSPQEPRETASRPPPGG
jgi:hypothetical protein